MTWDFRLIIIPFIGAVIGWITNVLAIKLIFRPLKPWRVPLAGWTVQGLIPKRQAEIAANVGQVVETELISMEEIIGEVNSPQRRDQVVNMLSTLLKQRLSRRLPGFLPQSVKDMVGGLLDDVLKREGPLLLEHLTGNLARELTEEIRVHQLVEKKMREFDLKQLERLVVRIAATELRHIEILGAVLGFLIGLVQVGVFLLL